jgi:hypothetical protein
MRHPGRKLALALAILLIVAIVSLVTSYALFSGRAEPGEWTIRVLGANGQPIAGARLTQPRDKMAFLGPGQHDWSKLRTDGHGLVRIRRSKGFRYPAGWEVRLFWLVPMGRRLHDEPGGVSIEAPGYEPTYVTAKAIKGTMGPPLVVTLEPAAD